MEKHTKKVEDIMHFLGAKWNYRILKILHDAKGKNVQFKDFKIIFDDKINSTLLSRSLQVMLELGIIDREIIGYSINMKGFGIYTLMTRMSDVIGKEKIGQARTTIRSRN